MSLAAVSRVDCRELSTEAGRPGRGMVLTHVRHAGDSDQSGDGGGGFRICFKGKQVKFAGRSDVEFERKELKVFGKVELCTEMGKTAGREGWQQGQAIRITVCGVLS